MEMKHEARRAGERLSPILVVGLFETPMDARETLEALVKMECAPERIGLAARDEAADAGGQNERHNALAEAVEAAGLAPLPARLVQMVLAVVPERGTYLLAGALTRALASLPAAAPLAGSPVQQALGKLGFAEDEARYLDDRLLAGAMLVAVAGDMPGHLDPVREVFAAHDAIHIGAARVEDPALLASGMPDSLVPGFRLAGETLLVDVVAPVVRLSELVEVPERVRSIYRKPLRGAAGEAYGTIIDLFGKLASASGREEYQPSYALIEYGGILGIGQRHVLVPADLLEDSGEGLVRLPVSADVIDNAPAFNLDFPLSRREEALICAYYGTLSAWEIEYGERGG